jgi:hypothetical protein
MLEPVARPDGISRVEAQKNGTDAADPGTPVPFEHQSFEAILNDVKTLPPGAVDLTDVADDRLSPPPSPSIPGLTGIAHIENASLRIAQAFITTNPPHDA